MDISKEELYLRQLDILKPSVCDIPIHIIGCGATGSFTSLSLAKMGFTNQKVYDFDRIEKHNFPNQLFPTCAIGKNKAEALAALIEYFTGDKIEFVPEKFEGHKLEGIVISALDSMEGRKYIYECCTSDVKLLIDPRTGAEVVRLFTIQPEKFEDRSFYEGTLYTDEQAERVPCTARAIIYSVLVVSAFVAKQVKQFQMGQSFAKELTIDLKNDYLDSPALRM